MDQQENISRTVGAMKKNGKLKVVLVSLAFGVILLLFGGEWAKVFFDDDEKNAASPSEAAGEGLELLSMEEYRTAMEQRVITICSRVRGAGNVYAVVNLAGGYEYVYATDQKLTANGETLEHIIIGNGNSEKVVYLTERVPEILGIGVVCSGGNDPGVKGEITQLLSAAFGVGVHKIYVTGGA
ncbi:MAG: hypothetical protein IJW00_07120 [Clostridia bacterium]|nr:hypothetical protein [Clostridia bacterium]